MFAQKTRGLFAGWAGASGGARGWEVWKDGYLCVAMEPTEVDKRSNDCGYVTALAKRVAGVFDWKCRSVCVCVSPGREVLIGLACAAVRVQGSFQL